MTDSQRTRAGGKRERLVGAASELLHQNGVARTSLAKVAAAADVPLGNVYYYFKTKDELVRAVIAAHAEAIRTELASLERQYPFPLDRLKAFARSLARSGADVSRHGCPHGTLCSELGKHEDGLDTAAAALMGEYVDWAGEQFRLLGKQEEARDLALTLVSVFQGASLLTHTFRDPDVMRGQAEQLERWLVTVAQPL
ncbi:MULTISPECIES: TetR/AcrR family transcriptional regulator [unclassified Streptomyces]|uniref:TetR/AcrR family transcriptional regulator n=1 Tax=unclassified Streptomyces TaxID=2593676 RepID=UPI001F03701D|nr:MULTISPECIES: TetR/AcrR family transcriptional regulator [unclassified Streptomyces]MCH0567033.1 TetR/AcrR family transcriptional regulator [Streptomyces sp. MUM 2J]MCH0572400.1 TetR/AcrR family transcriptional regulator [Streptomyces sp. MUM 136J]